MIRPFLLVAAFAAHGLSGTVATPSPQPRPEPDSSAYTLRIAQLIAGDRFDAFHPGALTSLLEEVAQVTATPVHPDPEVLTSFEDEALLRHPIVYANYADRPDWSLTPAERTNLKNFLDRGGFLFIDAGINADFLRGNVAYGQRHSYGAWEVTPDLEELFADLYPRESFQPLPRSHEIFRAFYSGLPDAETLPETVREYVVNEKWPQGTYSFMGLYIDGRLAVLATPIIAMGWARDEWGQWLSPIGFRVLESAEGLSERLSKAAYSGVSYQVRREDGREDTVYCQPETLPAWIKEPDGRWRVVRYHYSAEISDYAHRFYTQLGVNVLTYALTQ